MRRVSDESGKQAGLRNMGRFFLFMIPSALGGAAILWIIAAFGWIDLTRELRMGQRTMQSVGLSVLPRTPIVLLAHDGLCLKADSSYMDGNRLQFYAKNTCDRWLPSPSFSYRIKAHNGTVIDSHLWAFNGDRAIGPQERREQYVHVDDDRRAETVELWMIDGRGED